MKIQLENGRPASEETIHALETALGYRLSESFRAFVQRHNGAEPETNVFGSHDICGVNQFIPVEEILEERQHLDDIPKKAYPVAYDGCGNYVFINEGRNGAVYFWDHEVPGPCLELAPDFAAFLDGLEPFDIDSAEIGPADVKRVWIDPEFAKKHQKQGGETDEPSH